MCNKLSITKWCSIRQERERQYACTALYTIYMNEAAQPFSTLPIACWLYACQRLYISLLCLSASRKSHVLLGISLLLCRMGTSN